MTTGANGETGASGKRISSWRQRWAMRIAFVGLAVLFVLMSLPRFYNYHGGAVGALFLLVCAFAIIGIYPFSAVRLVGAFLVLALAYITVVEYPCFQRSRLAADESFAIGTMGKIEGGKHLNANSLALSMADCFSDRTPALDGSFSAFGYRFTIEPLKGFGGECVVARPLVYNRSGLNTFVLAPDGTVYQRDLGDENVPAPSTWDPKSTDEAWIVCE